MSLDSVARLLAATVFPSLIALGVASATAGSGVNQCLDCHTTPARLVPAVRELERNSKGLPRGSTEFEGEG